MESVSSEVMDYNSDESIEIVSNHYGVSKPRKSDRVKSTASQASKGLKFVNKADDDAGWTVVEERFVEITAATTDGLLPRSKFGECIGLDSREFALALFDSLSRRRFITTDMINKEQLWEFWEQLSDKSFDSRLKTFFDMVDTDSNGRITEDQVRKIINLSSTANNLSNIQRQRDEYAAMIMEELDPENFGYITIESLECLLMQAEMQNVSKNSEESKKLSAKLKITRDPNLLKRYYFETWMHLTVPTTLYACERLIRAFRSNTVTLRKVEVLPDMLNLIISKPRNFEYKSGQYILVNCPSVSQFEWHPFSITSAPQDDYLSVHIKLVGDWTKAVQQVFSEVCEPPQVGGANNFELPKIMIDGPYRAPAQDYKKYEVVLLIGLGIGAAPMISIIKDINQNTEANEHQQGNNKESFKTRKAYFYWLTKEQGSYSWFKNIMNEIVERDASNVIELHNYCTSIYEEVDARSAFILMLQSLNHAKYGMDIVSGTRVKTHFAKPNWENVYKHIAIDHPGSHVGVFYCGELALAKELRHLASEFTHKTTRFSFHEENFYPQY